MARYEFIHDLRSIEFKVYGNPGIFLPGIGGSKNKMKMVKTQRIWASVPYLGFRNKAI